MKKPTLEEVKEYFKDADTIKNRFGKEFKINIISIGYCVNSFMNLNDKDDNSDGATLWDEQGGYAKILSYKKPKEETFLITKEQVNQLFRHGHDLTKGQLQGIFPKAFEEEKKELVEDFTGWAFAPNKITLGYFKKNVFKYGFTEQGYFDTNILKKDNFNDSWIPATNQEVEEALIKEAVNRGFKEGCYFNTTNALGGQIVNIINEPRFGFVNNWNECYLLMNNYRVFDNGKWASLIPTITTKQAEEKLNNEFKIV